MSCPTGVLVLQYGRIRVGRLSAVHGVATQFRGTLFLVDDVINGRRDVIELGRRDAVLTYRSVVVTHQ